MALIDYSTTPANNNSAPPNGAPEGMAAASVNDTMRQIMADIKDGVALTLVTKAAMSALDASKLSEGSVVRTLAHTTFGDGGGGFFRVTKLTIATEVTADTQGGVHIPFDSDGTGASGGFVRDYTVLTNSMFGAKNDGVTDDSVANQAAVDIGKGGTVIIEQNSGNPSVFAALLLDGATYDNTTLIVEDMLLLARVGTTNNFQSAAWVGIIFKETDNCGLIIKNADGNFANHADEQHVYIAGLAGNTNMKIPYFNFRNVRGDGLYVSGANWLSGGNPDKGLAIGSIIGENVTDQGRNTLSIINATDWSVGYFRSHRVGGIVGGVGMPGGLDIEPNTSSQEVRRGVVGTVDIICGSNFGFALDGEEITPLARDFNVSDITIVGGTVTNTSGSTAIVLLVRAFNININLTARGDGVTRSAAVAIDECDGVSGVIKTWHTTDAVTVGYNTVCNNIHLEIFSDDFNSSGLRTILVDDSSFKGRVSNAAASGNRFGVWLRDFNLVTPTQNNVKYSIDCDNSNGNMVRGFRNDAPDPIAGVDCLLHDMDLSQFANQGLRLDGMGAGFKKSNVLGITNGTAIPTTAAWGKGDVIQNDTPTIDGNNLAIMGWLRLTDGTANVSGTDWAIMRVSHVSPAT